MLPSTRKIMEQVHTWLSEIEGLEVTLTLPEETATFPVCVITPPISTGYMHEQHINLRFSVEVWHNTQYLTMDIFDLVTEKMVSQGIGLRNNTNIYQDPIIKKYRMTGSFECRYNCITGAIEPNF